MQLFENSDFVICITLPLEMLMFEGRSRTVVKEASNECIQESLNAPEGLKDTPEGAKDIAEGPRETPEDHTRRAQRSQGDMLARIPLGCMYGTYPAHKHKCFQGGFGDL